MTATATIFPPATRAALVNLRPHLLAPTRLLGLLLLLPATGFLVAFFVLPALTLFAYSVLTQRADGIVTLPLTLSHLRHFFGTGLYTHVLFSTLRMAAITAAVAALLGYPVALVMVRSNALVMRVMTIVVIAPLIVSVVVRTYGWQLILANTRTGVLELDPAVARSYRSSAAHSLLGNRRRYRLLACLLPDDGAAACFGPGENQP